MILSPAVCFCQVFERSFYCVSEQSRFNFSFLTWTVLFCVWVTTEHICFKLIEVLLFNFLDSKFSFFKFFDIKSATLIREILFLDIFSNYDFILLIHVESGRVRIEVGPFVPIWVGVGSFFLFRLTCLHSHPSFLCLFDSLVRFNVRFGCLEQLPRPIISWNNSC